MTCTAYVATDSSWSIGVNRVRSVRCDDRAVAFVGLHKAFCHFHAKDLRALPSGVLANIQYQELEGMQ